MVTDIQRLRDIEQKMYHERQLATIGKLAAKVAHDINNPLTVIANITRLLLHGNTTDSRLSEDLATILKSCERCTDIAVNLLRFSRPLKLNRKPIELGSFCREAIEHSRRRLTAMTLTLRACPEPVMVEGDEFQLGRVLDNLVNNAFQASAGSEVVLEYGVAQGRAYFAVIDQGKGFTTEAIDHLFEPFFTTKPDGSGLGLASSLAVVSAHGGELTVTAADKGHVTAWLPLL
jgi:signal transduction histidine kinase